MHALDTGCGKIGGGKSAGRGLSTSFLVDRVSVKRNETLFWEGRGKQYQQPARGPNLEGGKDKLMSGAAVCGVACSPTP